MGVDCSAKKAKKILKTISFILLYTALAFGLLAVIFTLTAKRSEYGASQIFGYQFFTVESESMEKSEICDVSAYDVKSIPLHSLVFVQLKPEDKQELQEWYSSLEVGDVLSFRYRYAKPTTITHRIVSISENSTGGYIIELRGDNGDGSQLTQTINTSHDATGSNYIIGKVTGQSRLLGALLFAIGQPLGLMFIIIVPCIIIILLEIFRIVTVIGEDKRKKLLEEQRKKDDEIERLKKRVAELEINNTSQNEENN